MQFLQLYVSQKALKWFYLYVDDMFIDPIACLRLWIWKLNLLEQFGMQSSKPLITPLASHYNFQ